MAFYAMPSPDTLWFSPEKTENPGVSITAGFLLFNISLTYLNNSRWLLQ